MNKETLKLEELRGGKKLLKAATYSSMMTGLDCGICSQGG